MREKVVEAYLRKQVQRRGGKAYKFVSPGNDGVPDRIVCLQSGKIWFVELKAPGKVPTQLQYYRMRELQRLGQRVAVIDSKEAADRFFEEADKR